MTDKAGEPERRAGSRARTIPGQGLLNVFVRGLLRTPGLSSLIGNRLLTLYLVGRKTGRRYSIPVAYLADGDDLLLGTSARWKLNLRSGQPIAVRFRGKRRWFDVTTYSEESDVVSAYGLMARGNPAFAKLNNIRLRDDGEPDETDLRLAWVAGARAIRLSSSPL
jgi:hypothetical protein